MLTEIRVAGCAFEVTVEGRPPSPPRNLLDMDLRDEVESGRLWKVRVGPDSNMHAATSGWSGSFERRLFHGEGCMVEFGDRAVRASHDPARIGAAHVAAQFAVLGALRREGRAELHAAAVVPPDSAIAILLVAESGHGKSTLTMRAIASGWGFLSDDLIAVFANAAGELVLAPLRRTLRVSESAVPLLPTLARDGRWNSEEPPKMIVDPETCGLGRRHARARPGRVVFLERGQGAPTRQSISRGEAFERLMRHSPHLAFDPDAKSAIDALRGLADEVPAAVASLPLDSLHDVATLEDLLA